ncbi:MAG TPA: PIN domain-containing protein [Candidatus Acidoferrales bacterium]|nr:PIN domain-containing protein [Candidatus Acidoferrales bacterium]
MREFFDSSVLIAAFWSGHVHHEPSIRRFASAEKKHSACALHTLAEVYAGMTALPVKPVIPPEQALLFGEEIRHRLTLVSLGANEYFECIRMAADRGLTSGCIYDALLLRCAAKCQARAIYTWNLKHFRAIAPDLEDLIRNP